MKTETYLCILVCVSEERNVFLLFYACQSFESIHEQVILPVNTPKPNREGLHNLMLLYLTNTHDI